MPHEPETDCQPLIPREPIAPEVRDLSNRMQPLFDGQPKSEAQVSEALAGAEIALDIIAAGLYSLASMLVGEGEESAQLVESVVANPEITLCCNLEEARASARRLLCDQALEVLSARPETRLGPPAGLDDVKPCIEDDELSSAGISTEELEAMMAGPDRQRVRVWLESLPVAHRLVFVLRAVAGIPARQAAGVLRHHAGPSAQEWTADIVREVFRQALCSLASQLLHASTGQ